MLALTQASYSGQIGPWFTFNLEQNFELRLVILEPGLARVVLRRNGGYRLDRGW